jgi:hypothetical protein
MVIFNGHSPTGKVSVRGTGYVTAMAVGQRQRFYSGVRMFTGNYLSSPSLRSYVQAGLAINENGRIVRSRRNRPLYAVSEVTFL